MKYDIGIIGAGPAGYSAAFKAKKEGLKAVVFEMNQNGGTCLNRGCIPTKALLHVSQQYRLLLEKGREYGIRTGNLGYRFDDMQLYKNNIVDKLRDNLTKALNKAATVVNGKAVIRDEHTIECNGETYEVENILIAAGSKPFIPPFEGHDLDRVFSSDAFLEDFGIEPDSLLIIGGGVIGLEIGCFYLDLGIPVTIVEMTDRLVPTFDSEIAQRLSLALKKKGAVIATGATVNKVVQHDINHVETFYTDNKGNQVSVVSQCVLAATGRRANVEGLLAEGFELECERGAVVADENGRTSKPNIFVAGDCKAHNIQLAHLAAAQGENVIDIIMGREPQINCEVVPSCLYTSPQAASVGLSEKQAKDAGIKVTSRKTPTGGNGKCLIEEGEGGYLKLVCDENDVIIGASMVGPQACEIIGQLAIAVEKKLTASQLGEVIMPHPSISELTAETARI